MSGDSKVLELFIQAYGKKQGLVKYQEYKEIEDDARLISPGQSEFDLAMAESTRMYLDACKKAFGYPETLPYWVQLELMTYAAGYIADERSQKVIKRRLRKYFSDSQIAEFEKQHEEGKTTRFGSRTFRNENAV